MVNPNSLWLSQYLSLFFQSVSIIHSFSSLLLSLSFTLSLSGSLPGASDVLDAGLCLSCGLAAGVELCSHTLTAEAVSMGSKCNTTHTTQQ